MVGSAVVEESVEIEIRQTRIQIKTSCEGPNHFRLPPNKTKSYGTEYIFKIAETKKKKMLNTPD